MSFDVNNFFLPLPVDINFKSYKKKVQGDEELRVRNICKILGCDGTVIAKNICSAHYARVIKTGSTQSHLPIKRRIFRGNLSRIPEARAWDHMMRRCNNPKDSRYYAYGGRGIKVCKRWYSFENFLKDMGRKPSPEFSLERIDNDKGYYPSNCKWATRCEQIRNRRISVTIEEAKEIISLKNKGLLQKDISRVVGRGVNTVYMILNKKHWTSNA